jgi:CheY-like chemotaxis protein
MPSMDGCSAATLIQSKGDSAASPIVAVTASTDSELVNLAISIGMVDVLRKPFGSKKLEQVLHAISTQKSRE